MKQLIFTLLIVFAIPYCLSAASVGDKVPGYVVLDNGKKIEGKIVIGSLIDNEMAVCFIRQGANAKKIYEPRDVKSYAFQIEQMDDMGLRTTTWVEYRRHRVDKPPKPFASTLVFLQLVETGQVNLYSYFLSANDTQSKAYNFRYYIESEQGRLQEVDNQSFERTAKLMFKNYTALTSRIGQQDFHYRDLDRIVRDYNYWMVNRHDSNEYRVAMKLDPDARPLSNDIFYAN